MSDMQGASPDQEGRQITLEIFRAESPSVDLVIVDLRFHQRPSAPPAVEPRIVDIVREFNEDADFALQRMPSAVQTSRVYLIPEQEQATLPARARVILDRYAVVDALALYYRNRTRTIFLSLLVSAFVAMVVFEVFAHILGEFIDAGKWPRLLVWLNPILWIAALLLWRYAHRRKYQKRFQDYRALAEGLRVQFFWNLLGLRDNVEDCYLPNQQGELDWICRALRCWRERDEKSITDPPLSLEQLKAHKDLACLRWIKDQFHYFAEIAGPREERKGKRYKRCGAILLWLSLVLAFGLGGWETSDAIRRPADAKPGLHDGESALVVSIGVLLVGAAAVIAYGEKMAFSEHARQYTATGVLFRNAADQLTDAHAEPAEAMKLFRELGEDALRENGDWLLLHRDRPLEVIVP